AYCSGVNPTSGLVGSTMTRVGTRIAGKIERTSVSNNIAVIAFTTPGLAVWRWCRAYRSRSARLSLDSISRSTFPQSFVAEARKGATASRGIAHGKSSVEVARTKVFASTNAVDRSGYVAANIA